MVNPRILHYSYYHCSKSKKPRCPQKAVSRQELERQIDQYLARIQISPLFKQWAIKYLHELHEGDRQSRNDMIQTQQKAYTQCLRQIDNMVKLKTSPNTTDGSLLSDKEYGQQRLALLKEKAALEELLNDAGHRVEKWLTLSEEIFEFACTAREQFNKGDPMAKKQILMTVGSNLILKDKKLSIEARKPFFLLENSLTDEEHQTDPIELDNMGFPQAPKEPNATLSPRLCAIRDEDRTNHHKELRAAALIYYHFKKQFGLPEIK